MLFPRLAGRRRAARYLLLGEPFGVDEALEIGLVSHPCRAGDVGRYAGADRRVYSPSRPKPCARRSASCVTGIARKMLERMALEGAAFAERLASPEVKEAISAFFEKRKPDFSRLA